MILTRRDRFILFSPLAVAAFLALGPTFEDGPTICPFALSTGMACPGCGMTRAAIHLFRGDLATALAFHPLIPMMSFLGVGGWVWFVLRRTGNARPISNRALNVILIATLSALVVVWVARLLTGTLPVV